MKYSIGKMTDYFRTSSSFLCDDGDCLWGDELLTASGVKPVKEILRNGDVRRIGLYFSASWCPPCQVFTPILQQLYEDFKEIDPNSIEIILCSLDTDEEMFNKYFDGMSWTAIPFSSEARHDLRTVCNITTVPSLVIVDTDGVIIDEDAKLTVEGFLKFTKCSKVCAKNCLDKWQLTPPR